MTVPVVEDLVFVSVGFVRTVVDDSVIVVEDFVFASVKMVRSKDYTVAVVEDFEFVIVIVEFQILHTGVV